MTSQLTIPFEIDDNKKIKQMIRTLKVAKANLATSKMNTDFYLQILKNERGHFCPPSLK
tara:strand:- start:5334 stop:5510 length:177 start_codon:yes stop_codon:yes gene_type:complete